MNVPAGRLLQDAFAASTLQVGTAAGFCPKEGQPQVLEGAEQLEKVDTAFRDGTAGRGERRADFCGKQGAGPRPGPSISPYEHASLFMTADQAERHSGPKWNRTLRPIHEPAFRYRTSGFAHTLRQVSKSHSIPILRFCVAADTSRPFATFRKHRQFQAERLGPPSALSRSDSSDREALQIDPPRARRAFHVILRSGISGIHLIPVPACAPIIISRREGLSWRL